MVDIRAEVANALHWDLAIPRHVVTAKLAGGWVRKRPPSPSGDS